MKYQTKVRTVNAIKFDGTRESAQVIIDTLELRPGWVYVWCIYDNTYRMRLDSSYEDTCVVDAGDFVIGDDQTGRGYACKPDIFHQFYEEI
jgi:hypothetical protein